MIFPEYLVGLVACGLFALATIQALSKLFVDCKKCGEKTLASFSHCPYCRSSFD